MSPRIGIVLSIVLAAGLGARCHLLTARSLWLDEAFSWRIIQFPFSEMLERIGRDNHPPLYFILLRGWAAVFGDSPLALRSLSVLFGCSTILGTYLFTREAFHNRRGGPGEPTRGDNVGLLAAALVALSAFQIRYSWEVRMYALATTLTIFSSWALFRALHASSRHRWWFVYALLALSLIYTHYYGLFTVASQLVFIAGFILARAGWHPLRTIRSPAFGCALVAAAILITGWLPWLPVFLRQKSQVQAAYWCRPIGGWDVPRLCYQMFLAPEALPPTPRPHYLVPVGLCLLGLWLLCRRGGAAEWYIVCCAAGPLAWCLLGEKLHVRVLTLRYFVMAHLFLLIGLAVLVSRISFAWERSIATIVLLAAALGVYVHFCQVMDVANRPAPRAAAEYIAQRRRPGEPIVVRSPHVFFPLLYYASDPNDHYLYTDDRPIPYFLGTSALTAGDLITAERLQEFPSQRVWVVDTGNGYRGTEVPVPPEWTAKHEHVLSDVFGLDDLIVIEYETSADVSRVAVAAP